MIDMEAKDIRVEIFADASPLNFDNTAKNQFDRWRHEHPGYLIKDIQYQAIFVGGIIGYKDTIFVVYTEEYI